MKDLIKQTAKAFNGGYRYIVHEGGTRSGKTHSILSVLYHIANSRPGITSVVSETFPHLRKGAIRDYKTLLQSQNAWDGKGWNKTESVHTLAEDKILEFFSADNSTKVHGPERDYLFINEGQNIPYEIVRHLFVRTTKTIFIDFNPTREFWAHTEIKEDPKTFWVHSTYKDNPFLTDEQVYEIEKNKKNKTWWAIYGEGKIAESEAAIYRGWKLIDEVPHEARLERYGLDFGYTNDPTTIDAIYFHNGGYIIDEITHQKGLSNKQIADILNSQEKKTLTIADSAEPKSIDELASYGVSVLPSKKGKGSVNQGIQYVQDQRISITKRSTNAIKEYRNYLWLIDKDEKTTNTPAPGFDHHMDACLEGNTPIDTTEGQFKIKNLVGKTGSVYGEGGKVRAFFNVRKTGVRRILQIDFENGKRVLCSGEHPFLLEDGMWCPAYLLTSTDVIRLVTYASEDKHENKANIQRHNILFVWKLLSKFFWKKVTCGCLGISQEKEKGWVSHTPRRWKHRKQSNRKSSGNKTTGSFEKTLQKKATTLKDLARVKRGKSVSFMAWQGVLEEEKKESKKMLTLWRRIQYAISDKIKVLPPELQNESKTAKIKRIVRKTHNKTVYNLTVEDTCSYSINGGLIVHNCRYAINSLKPSDTDTTNLALVRNKRISKWGIS